MEIFNDLNKINDRKQELEKNLKRKTSSKIKFRKTI